MKDLESIDTPCAVGGAGYGVRGEGSNNLGEDGILNLGGAVGRRLLA